MTWRSLAAPVVATALVASLMLAAQDWRNAALNGWQVSSAASMGFQI